jgi:7-cyano-7-deazaguanine synthase in queuosine biosynthesis
MTMQTSPAKVRPDMVYEQSLLDAGTYGFQSLVALRASETHVRYFLDDQYLPSTGQPLPAVIADLLDVASTIMYADRKYRRSRQYESWTQKLGWMRTFKLKIGVREPEIWNAPQVKTAVEALLGWLTEDSWNLTFEKQSSIIRRRSDIQSPLPFQPASGAVVLFSGGLDSLAGVATLLESGIPLYLVSAVAPRMKVPGLIYERIAQRSNSVQYVPFPFYLVHSDRRDRRADDESQRSRGFLFLSFAAAVAVASGNTRIIVCENGIGAINLPMNWCQLGTQNTRAVHPRTLVEMTNLLNLLGFSQLSMELPFIWKTKGELCQELSRTQLRELCKYTVSCDNFPSHDTARRSENVEVHCGECTSCLLRREAITVAGLELEDTPADRYKIDLCRPLGGTKAGPHEHLKHMLDQVATFREATSSQTPWQMLLTAFPELHVAARAIAKNPEQFAQMHSTNVEAALCDLYRRYAAEWDNFPYSLAHV